MKYFTLSAVLVLVYCLLLVLSGIPGVYDEQSTTLTKLTMGSQSRSAGPAQTVPIAVAPTNRAKGLMDWIGANPDESGVGDYGKQVRTIGLLFIVGWVFISFKLLTLD
jgi:hypothetical protein